MSSKERPLKKLRFQKIAIDRLLVCMKNDKRDIVFKSPTGSGKTVMLTRFMDRYLNRDPNAVFIWLTPGIGELEEQSQRRMKTRTTKSLKDVQISGFKRHDCCFFNWESLRESCNAMRGGDDVGLRRRIKDAHKKGICFKVIVDESHSNNTVAAKDIIELFGTDKIVRSSATPPRGVEVDVEVEEADVIAEGLIKRRMYINKDLEAGYGKNQIDCLLGKGLEKQKEIREHFVEKGLREINPLIVVQLPNDNSGNDSLLKPVEIFFKEKKIPYAVCLTGNHKNMKDLTENNAEQVAVIIKQAIATGWDCQRAYILIKLRQNMEETFEIQTIGRIRRMPYAKHFEDDVLDSCYIYTFHDDFGRAARAAGAVDVECLSLEDAYKNFQKGFFGLMTQIRTERGAISSDGKILRAITRYFHNEFKIYQGKKWKGNEKRLEAHGFHFSDKLLQNVLSGEVRVLNNLRKKNLNTSTLEFELPVKDAECMLNYYIDEIAQRSGIHESERIKRILFRLFCEEYDYAERILSLSTRETYTFIINNFKRLHESFRKAMETGSKREMALEIEEKPFTVPETTQFIYKKGSKLQEISEKNIYKNYLYATEPRSAPEREFEVFCEDCSDINWVYKNGDRGKDYFSIAYKDEGGNLKLFYPDYILSIKGTIWIIEIKGPFKANGADGDIDGFSKKKFNALKAYLVEHPGFKGGFVRYDEVSRRLFISIDNYAEDICSKDWRLLKKFIKDL